MLFSAALAGLGMLGSALARDYAELLSLRVLTGIGIGGTIASVAVIVSEHAPDKLVRTRLEPVGYLALDGITARHHRELGDGGTVCRRTTALYPTAIRTTGIGWAIGIGRFGAILAPLASGALLDRGWLPAQLYFFFSATFILAAIAIFFIGPARAPAAA